MTVARLGAFELIKPLARGGMGRVWLGRLAGTHEPAAIKVLPEQATANPAVIAAVLEEIRTMAAMSHPNIVRVWDTGRVPDDLAARSGGELAAGSPWLAMELAAGGTLQRRARQAPLPWSMIRVLLDALLSALAHAHARGVIHRDLKPANLLLATATPSRESLRLTDFGVAHALEHHVKELVDASGRPLAAGTPRYMAPEQFFGTSSDHGPWTDLYALGCVAWWMVTGQPPYDFKSISALAQAHSSGQLPRLAALVPVPPDLEDWLRILLRTEPEARYHRAETARLALAELHRPGAPTPGPAAYDPRPLEEDPPDATTVVIPRLEGLVGSGEVERQDAVGTVPDTWRSPTLDQPDDPRGAGLGVFAMRVPRVQGRVTERDRLWEALRTARVAGRTRAVVIRGPSGLGKSRLAAWLGERAHELGLVEVFRATHQPDGGPWDGLRGLAGRAFRVLGLEPEVAEQRVGARVPGLGTLLASPSTLEPADRHRVATRVVARLAPPRVALIHLDDVHWGLDTLRWARGLLERQELGPALLLLTVRDEALIHRPDEDEALEAILDRDDTTELELGPLDDQAQQALLHELLVLDPHLSDRLRRRTAGNPLYAVQLVASLVRRGELVRTPHGFDAGEEVRLALGSDLAAVWRERIEDILTDRPAWLTPLLAAAVLGLEVNALAWQRACAELGVEAPSGLVLALLAERLASLEGDRIGARWVFAHGMFRDALLDRTRAEGQWAAIHRAAANALRDLGPAGQGRAGLHLLEAGDLDEAAELLLLGAGVHRFTDPDETARWLQARDAALAAVEPPTSTRRLRGLAHLGWVERSRRRYDRASELAEQALRLSIENLEVQHQAIGLLFQMACEQGQLDRARELVQLGAALAMRHGDPNLEVRALERVGEVEMRAGHLDAAEKYLRRALAVQGADDVGPAAALLARIMVLRGNLEEAGPLAIMARDHEQATGRLVRVADAEVTLGEVARGLGDLSAAEDHHTAALTGYRTVGSPYAAVPLINLALISMARDDYATARRQCTDALESAGAMGSLAHCARTMLVQCAAVLGAWDDYDRWLEAVTSNRGALVEPDLAHSLEAAGHAALAAGFPERAAAAWSEALLLFKALSDHGGADRVLDLLT